MAVALEMQRDTFGRTCLQNLHKKSSHVQFGTWSRHCKLLQDNDLLLIFNVNTGSGLYGMKFSFVEAG